jgi:hypothetical protein
MHRREAHPEEETNLEQLALQQLNLIDIQIIAVGDPYDNQHQHEVPIPPTITDPFWREFNDWRRNNPNDYDECHQEKPLLTMLPLTMPLETLLHVLTTYAMPLTMPLETMLHVQITYATTAIVTQRVLHVVSLILVTL